MTREQFSAFKFIVFMFFLNYFQKLQYSCAFEIKSHDRESKVDSKSADIIREESFLVNELFITDSAHRFTLSMSKLSSGGSKGGGAHGA